MGRRIDGQYPDVQYVVRSDQAGGYAGERQQPAGKPWLHDLGSILSTDSPPSSTPLSACMLSAGVDACKTERKRADMQQSEPTARVSRMQRQTFNYYTTK